MKIAQEIGIILGISERQVHRRLADSEPLALRTLKSILVLKEFGRNLDSAAHSLENCLPDTKKLDPKFYDYIHEAAYRLRQWQTIDSAPREMENYWTYSEPLDRNDYIFRNTPYEEFKQECKDHEEKRLEALAALRKKLTGSAEPPPPEPEKTEMGPQSEPSAIADTPPEETSDPSSVRDC